MSNAAVQKQTQLATQALENFLEGRKDELKTVEDAIGGNPRDHVVIVEPTSGRTVFAFRKPRRYWAGTPEETQRLINALTDAMVAADALRNSAKEPLKIDMPESMEELLDSTFDLVDMRAITQHETWTGPIKKLGES